MHRRLAAADLIYRQRYDAMRTHAGKIIVWTVLTVFVGWIASWAWPPDIISPRVHVLASAASLAGDRFQVVQYWNRGDFYTTELEHLAPDGIFSVQQINWDDGKQWLSRIRVSEHDKRAFVTFPGDARTWEHDWAARAFVAPFDSREVDLVLRTWRRSSPAKGGEYVKSTDSWVTEAGQRHAADDGAYR